MAKDYLNVRIESVDFDTSIVDIHKLHGREVISQLFSFDLEIIYKSSEAASLDDMTGAEAWLVFERADEEVRRIHGMICEVENRFATEEQFAAYRLKFVPRAWRCTLVETLDIFLGLTVPEIIQKKLELVDLGTEGVDFEFRLLGTYPKRDFVVQYKETDLAFISRLAEHVGISFHFEHDPAGSDKIVFSDNVGGFRAISGDKTVTYRRRGEQVDVFDLRLTRKCIPGTYVCRDYNYRTPQVELHSQHDIEEGFGGGVIEYGSHFKSPTEGDTFAEIRAQEARCTYEVFSGASDVQRFSAGSTFELTGHPSDNPKLLLVEVEHTATQSVGTRGSGDERTYTNSYKGIDSSLTYRPPRNTAIPRVYGVVTGVIETGADGAIGKFAKIDEQGRYTVKFLFDTAAPGERQASHPVRRMQAAVGPNYGMHFPLRPGIEVLITFIDGDPDRPLIVAAVPNPVTPTPVDVGVSTKNRLKTESGVLFEIEDGSGS